MNEDNDFQPSTEGLKYYSGSVKENITASDKVRKSYDLFRMIIKG